MDNIRKGAAYVAHCATVIITIPASILLYITAGVLWVEVKLLGKEEIAEELAETIKSPIGYIRGRISMLSPTEW